jgi:hypothetical protein
LGVGTQPRLADLGLLVAVRPSRAHHLASERLAASHCAGNSRSITTAPMCIALIRGTAKVGKVQKAPPRTIGRPALRESEILGGFGPYRGVFAPRSANRAAALAAKAAKRHADAGARSLRPLPGRSNTGRADKALDRALG